MPQSDSPKPDKRIAIVGMACQFPGAPDLGAYWANIRSGKVSFEPVPADRWRHEQFYHPGSRELDKTYARKLGIVDDIWSFAALHHGLPPLRVKVTDPQHRLLIDAVRIAIADAGYETRAFPRESTGVFVGASVAEHKDLITSRLRAHQILNGEFGQVPPLPPGFAAASVEDVTPVRAFSIAGNLLNMMAATVAQTFDLGGPAFTIDAACSSSLVATYEAVTYLRAGLCDVAIAGGAYLCLTPDNMVGFSRIGAISKSDACRPFDAGADGFVLGEGVGAVVLKRLEDALRDGDRIYAVVRGAGINNDGRGDGPMSPRPGGQIAVLERAYADADVTPDTVGFVEAHGTATTVGDVVEVGALRSHFEAHAAGPIDCVISSVKANIGHTMSAAGVAGLIKAALVVSEGRLPPQAAYGEANPALGLGNEFRVVTAEEEWQRKDGAPRRAGVSSFGFGGTNCHLVLDEAPVAAVSDAARPEPFVISAPTAALLTRHLTAIRAALADGPAARAPLADLAYTLSALRQRESCAVAFAAGSLAELHARLDEAMQSIADGISTAKVTFSAAPLAADARKIAFLFPGQGAQAVDLCRALYDRFPAFRARLDQLASGLDDLLERPLLSYLYPAEGGDRELAGRGLTQTEICQPAMAALGLALAELLGTLGISPSVVAGHSLGELVAAGAAGLLTPEAALRFVAERGRVMRDLALPDAGAMLAIGGARDAVVPYVTDGVVLANVNHPGQVVASGTTAGIDALAARLTAAGIKHTRLAVSHAFHSPLMAGARAPLAALVAKLATAEPRIPVVSCIRPGTYDVASARDIFVEHATAPVDFVAGVEACAAAGATIWIQVGAGSALTSMARATLVRRGAPANAFVSLALTDADDTSTLCASLAQLAAIGVPVDFARFFAGRARPAWLPATPLITEEYRAVTHTTRPALPALEPRTVEAHFVSGKNGKSEASEAMVALFREQMAVFAQQNEIIAKQAALLGVPMPAAAAGPTPAVAKPVVAAAVPAPAAVPATPTIDTSGVDDKLLDLVAAVSAFPRSAVHLDKRLVGDLGFDSLMMVELATKSADAFPGLGGFPKTLFVNDPTVRTLSAHIKKTLTERHSAPTAKTGISTIHRYVPILRAAPLPPLPDGAIAPFAGPIAILADRRGIAPLVAKLLGARGLSYAITDAPDANAGIVDLRGLDATLDHQRDPVLAAFRLATAAKRPLFAVAHFALAGAGLTGFAKALAREWPESRVKALDLDAAATVESLAQQIVAELLATDATVEVVYRKHDRHVVALTPAPALAGGTLPEHAVVAISGGARGLGRKVAVALADQHHARIVLLGRAKSDDGAIAEIRAAGGEAVYQSCDVTDAAAVDAALTAGRRAFGPIQAVVHAAGVLADAPVGRKSEADFARVFDTKAGGMLALRKASASDPVRSFLVLSSWSGRFGNAAQTDYAAANHLVAALAQDSHATAIDLPPWTGSGMLATMAPVVRAALAQSGVPFLDDATGLSLLLAALGSPIPGEILVAGAVAPDERDDVLALQLSRKSHAHLDDHQINGRPVLPLAAAADLALSAATRVLGTPARLTSLELLDGVRLERDDVSVTVAAHADRGDVSVTITTGAGKDARVAYRAQALAASGPLPELVAPAGEEPALPLADFYAKHTFHGPRWQGIRSVSTLSKTHIAGTVRTGGIAHQTLDPLLVDGSLQLAGYWAALHHGRGGLPLALGEVRLLAPIPANAEVHCVLRLEHTAGDLFTGDLDYRDGSGQLVLQIRGAQAQLAASPAVEKIPAATRPQAVTVVAEVDPSTYRIDRFPDYLALRQRLDLAKAMGVQNPYFNVHERVTNDTSVIDGREVINFSSYNYLGLSGDDDVNRAVIAATERYGTSVSASRIASGEKPLHRELERALADFLGAEDAVVFVGGHATNVGVVGHIVGPGDLIMHDALAHDSILGGAKLSGAKRRPFPHNDFAALDATLREIRGQFRRVLIAMEGVYSMDGDIPNLPAAIAVKKRHHAMLLVDEAHSLGVLGARGGGIGEHFDVNRADVDLWMGTMSKSLASCGGYIAGSAGAVEYLKYTMPGFVFSVGISPPNAASALAALTKLVAHPETVTQLRERARFFLEACRARGIDTGMSEGSAVIPCIVGNSWTCLQLAQALNRRGINVQPILYPAVEEHLARLRFFVTSRHSEAQLTLTADAIAEELAILDPARFAKPELRGMRALNPPSELRP